MKRLCIFLLCFLAFITTSLAKENHLTLYKPDIRKQRKHKTKDLLVAYLERSEFRHKVIAQNIANVNTPGYKANEVEMPDNYEDLNNGAKVRTIRLRRTSAAHIANNNKVGGGKLKAVKLKDPHEVKLNGNNVSLSQQMTKLSQNQQNYNMALKAYTATNNLLSILVEK
ncbi:MAG: flagellar basal body rod protein FlgB [Rickettsiaceae bacterium]|nr:flagellar basal body rod protein FlgB [Rickettsiaceae bacterium]